MSRQNVWILSRLKTARLDGRRYCDSKSQREALLLPSPLVVTRSQCCFAIIEQHKNKIRLNPHDRRQSLQLESSLWQARVIHCDCMIYLASLGEEEASWEFSNSFLHHFYSYQSKLQRAGTEWERSINGLLMLPSCISTFCYFKPSLRFTFRSPALCLF